MKKKIILFLLAVFLFFALLVAALCFFSPKENQDSKKDMTGQQDTAENTTEQPAEEREQFHFFKITVFRPWSELLRTHQKAGSTLFFKMKLFLHININLVLLMRDERI